ncbi:MAG: ornithine acetyltransferase [Deltaproteobacteria bacterium]|nr:MAG: ornithine acetyltransferase [Deltaproteobacteria bacterium]
MVPRGFKFAAVEAGIKYSGRLDLGLILCEGAASVAATFTKNTIVAAPVTLSKERIKSGYTRGVLVNSGNANACNGEAGMTAAIKSSAKIAAELGIASEDLLVCSTGVIGLPLPAEKFEAAAPSLIAALCDDISPFSRAIMTTDLVPKVASRSFKSGQETITVTGIAKGSGMIKPNMATMLAFIVTDAGLETEILRKSLVRAVELSFNRITVDGDTSTNDTAILMASGAGGKLDDVNSFDEALTEVLKELARMIVKDGEGATKVVDITVTGAKDEELAKRAAFTIAESPLVKTALYGEDPNWGRIAGALGRSGAHDGGPFSILVGDVEIVAGGVGVGADAERRAHEIMTGDEFSITIKVGDGPGEATVTTCDFSEKYITINADYRS